MSVIYLIVAGGALDGPITLVEVPGIGCQIPDNAIELEQELTAPPEGFAWALVNGLPGLLADHRGTVYSTANGAAQTFDALGELLEGLTLEPPPGQFYVWNAGAWQLDAAAQEVAAAAQALLSRDEKLRMATVRIAPLQDAHDLGESTAGEEAALLSWKRYRIALSRIEQHPGYPMTIEWPAPPGVTVTP